MLRLRAAGRIVAVLALVLLWAAVLAQGLPGDLLLDAGRAMDAKQWEQALKPYKQFIQSYPDHEAAPLAYFAIGECLFNLQRYEEARESYATVATRYPQWSDADDAFFRIGNCLFQLGDYGGAADAFAQMLEKYPDSPIKDKASYWLGEAYYQNGDAERAIGAYGKSLAAAPRGDYAPYALYSIATIRAEGDKRSAISSFKELLGEFPDSELVPDALYRIGQAYEALGQFGDAISYYHRVTGEQPDSEFVGHAMAGIASVHLAEGRFENASREFREVADRFPGTAVGARAALRAADAMFAGKHYSDAAAVYAAVAGDADNPNAAVAGYWEAVAYQLDGQTEAAIGAFQQFLRKHPEHPQIAEAYLRLGALYYAADRLGEARDAYKHAAQRAGDNDLALEAEYAAAWTAYHQDKSPQALETLRALLVNNPTTQLAARNALPTAELHLSEGQYQAAAELAGIMLKHDPQHPHFGDALLISGRAHQGIGETELARRELERVVAEYGSNGRGDAARAGLVLVNIDAGDLAAATKLIEQIDPDSPSATGRAQLHYAVAEAYGRRREWEKASTTYMLAYEADPKSAWAAAALLGAGDAAMAAGSCQSAADAFQRFLRDFANATEANQAAMQLGMALSRLGHYEEATKQLEKATAAEPQAAWAPQALMELADAYVQAGKPVTAVETYLRIADAYPQHELAPEGLFWAAELRYKRGSFAAAGELYSRLLAQYASSSLADAAHYKLGWAMLKTDRADEALSHFRIAAAAQNPKIALDARLQAGYILVQKGDYAAAVEVLEPGSEMEDGEQLPALLYLLGQAYLGSDEAERAAPVLQRITEEFPASPYVSRAKLALARTYKELGNYEQARQTLAGLVEAQDPLVRAQAQFETAELSRLQNDLPTAAQLYMKAVADQAPPGVAANALYAAGVCYEKLGQVKDAVAAYRQLVDRLPGETTWVERAQQRLAELSGAPQ